MKPLMFLSHAAFVLTTSSVALAGDEQARPDAPAAASYVSISLNASVPSAVVPAPSPAATIDTQPRYKPVPPNVPLLSVGGLVLLSSYASTVILTAARFDPKNAQVAYLPLIGPWAYLANPIASTSLTTADTMLLIGGGVAQGIGAVLVVMSLFIPGPAPIPTVRAGTATLHLAPASFGVASAGAAAGGSF